MTPETDAVAVVTETLHRTCCFGDEDMCAWLAEHELTPCKDEGGKFKYLGHERAIVDALRAAGLLTEAAL